MSRERHRVTWLLHHAHSAVRGSLSLTNPPRGGGGGGGGPLLWKGGCVHTESRAEQRAEQSRELDEASGLVAVELSSRVVIQNPPLVQRSPPTNTDTQIKPIG
jgi:hypothetical protein